MLKHYSRWGMHGLLLILFLIGMGTEAFAQRYVYVPRGKGTLNAVISSDSLNRLANPNTVYLLQRGDRTGQPADSNYVLTTTLTNWGNMPLRLASYGTGPLPKIIPGLLPGGMSVAPPFNATADLYLKSVYITARDAAGLPNTRTIVTGANNIHIVLDSCQSNCATQSTVRAQHDSLKIYITNSILSNMNGDMGNGRVVDNRTITIDSLVMRNNLFVRGIRRAYREGGGTARVAIIEHNTFNEYCQDVLNLGNIDELTIQNNLFVDCGYLGSQNIITGIAFKKGRIRNNLFFADTAKIRASIPVTATLPAMFDSTARAFVMANGDSATNIFSPVSFAMTPNKLPKNAQGRPVRTDSIAKWYWANPTVTTTYLPQVDSVHLLNYSYDKSSAAWALGNDNRPAGCLLYFPADITGVEDRPAQEPPVSFALVQNFPNPFNPSTTLQYTLSHAGSVKLGIFDLLGREVKTIAAGVQNAGAHRMVFDASALTGGVYLVRFDLDGTVVASHKIMLLK